MNKNAMERLNDCIKKKNSRICAELNIDDESIPKTFKEKFTSETLCDEIAYEYFVTYLQAIVDIVPAVKIILKKKEMENVYWHVAEVSKAMGFFVISQISQEDIGYVIDNNIKNIIESDVLDSMIISMDIYGEINKVKTFLKLLKENGKGAFINLRRTYKEKEKQKWRIITRIRRKREPNANELFFEMQCNIDLDYVQGEEYSMIGIETMNIENCNIGNTDTFVLVSNYEQDQYDEIANAFDGNGLGALITMNLADAYTKDYLGVIYTEKTWAEAARTEAMRHKEKINTAIGKFYGS